MAVNTGFFETGDVADRVLAQMLAMLPPVAYAAASPTLPPSPSGWASRAEAPPL
ncbi:MAG: hypothetical protein ACLTMP_05650 [Eggerthella lenta]